MSERRRRSDRWSQPQLQQNEREQQREPLWHEMQEVVESPKEDISPQKVDSITHVVVVGGHSKIKVGSAVARGVAGAALLGPVGLLLGASAKRKEMITLLVHYESGKVETVHTKVGSFVFNTYAPYIVG